MANDSTERRSILLPGGDGDPPASRQRGNDLGEATADVAAAVGARRTELGLTRHDLAKRLTSWGRRFSANAVQKLEAGERRIDVDDLHALAGALDVSVEYLLNTEPDAERITWSRVIEIENRNPLLSKAIRDAVTVNHEPRADLLNFVEGAIRRAQWTGEWNKFLTAVQTANDHDAASMIAERLRNEPAFQPLKADVIAALLLGGDQDRADRIVTIATGGNRGEG